MIANYLTEKLFEEKIITETEIEIIQFGLENLENSFSNILLIMVISYFFNCIRTGAILCLVSIPLRKYAGGYHARTKQACFCISTFMLLFFFSVQYFLRWSEIMYVIVTVGFGCLIFMLAPIDNRNKKLDKIEKRIYRRKAKCVLLVESIFFLLALFIGWQEVICATSIAYELVGLSMIMELFRKYFFYENLKKK